MSEELSPPTEAKIAKVAEERESQFRTRRSRGADTALGGAEIMAGMRLAAVLTVATAVFLASCGDDDAEAPEIEAPASLEVTSSAFSEGDTIPTKYTCDGGDVSPPLQWSPRPASDAYVVTLTDPDAPGGTFTHWIVHAIPATITSFQEGSAPSEALLGENDFGDLGYGGPCPPEGDNPHRYVFTVYVIEGQPGAGLIQGGPSLDEVLKAIECCVGAKGTLTATYGR